MADAANERHHPGRPRRWLIMAGGAIGAGIPVTGIAGNALISASPVSRGPGPPVPCSSSPSVWWKPRTSIQPGLHGAVRCSRGLS